MKSVCKELCFDAAHRLYGYDGKCSRIHGHRYRVAVRLQYYAVDEVGIGFDFGRIKSTLGKWIDENWDHKFFICHDDPLYEALTDAGGIDPEDIILMAGNPTAENMAEFMAEVVVPIWPEIRERLISITIYETPTSSAEYGVDK